MRHWGAVMRCGVGRDGGYTLVEVWMNEKKVSPRRDKHTRSMLTDHMVFTPKFRHGVLTAEIASDLEKILYDIASEMGIIIMDISVNADHVHLFIQHSPRYSASEVAGRLKGVSSRNLRAMHPELEKWCSKGLWSPSCFHGSVGHGVDVVSAYIQGQDEHHGKKK